MTITTRPDPGRFVCEECGGEFDSGDDAAARAEALARGWDPRDCAVVCDGCYRLLTGGAVRVEGVVTDDPERN